MDREYKEKLEALINGGNLNDWARNAFTDILNRNPNALSIKQRAMIDKEYSKNFEGGTGEYPEIPDDYDFCKLSSGVDGYRIALKMPSGSILPIGKPVTKKEGLITLDWLNSAIPQLQREGLFGAGDPDNDVPF